MRTLSPSLLLGILLGCGSSVSVAASTAGPYGATSVHWVGIDPAPIAIGSSFVLNFAFSVAEASGQGYTVVSSNPAVLSAQDEGRQQILVTAISAGTAILTLSTALGAIPQEFTVAAPASVMFADRGHLAAHIDVPLPARFSLWQQEEIDAIVLDANGGRLASRGLTAMYATGLNVSPKPIQGEATREAWLVSPLPSSASTRNATLSGGFADAGSGSGQQFTVADFDAPAAIELEMAPSLDRSTVTVLYQALEADLHTKVLGIGNLWSAPSCVPQQCVVSSLDASAAEVAIPSGSDAGRFTFTESLLVNPGSGSVQGTLLSSTLALP